MFVATQHDTLSLTMTLYSLRMTPSCTNCGQTFEITSEDLAFLDKLSPIIGGKKQDLPAPAFCPMCRRQRRYAFRNERNLYHRKCAKTGKQIISQFANPDVKVYLNSEWWSDSWNGLDFGRDVDFSRPFFDQLQELRLAVPHPCVANDSSNVNSDYANQTGYLKNCYLLFDSDYDDSCLYLQSGKHCVSCTDSLLLFHCELCHDCIDCSHCYRCVYLQDCENCSDSYFLRDCKGCKWCFGCSGLRNKEYCMFNEVLPKDEYLKRIAAFRLATDSGMKHAKEQIRAWFLKHPVKEHHNVSAEGSTGDYLANTQNLFRCFDCKDARDCRYCTSVSDNATDCMDYDIFGFNAELLYDVITSGYNTSRVLFSFDCWSGVHDLLYCDTCPHSSYLFGCVGLKKNKYCVLNKQYTKEEYEELVPKIIAHMRKTGEWGHFLPIEKSFFGYNETAADQHFPLTRKEVEKRGWRWFEEPEKKDQYLGPPAAIPDDIADVSDDILKQILLCEATGKPYKIIPQELTFYREMQLPIPRLCPERRHQERFEDRNPRRLWERTCAKCQKPITTSYSPDRPEIVYCEECYLATVY